MPADLSIRAGVQQSAGCLRAQSEQEAKVRAAYPDVPLYIGSAPLYSANLQQTVMASHLESR